MRGMKYEINNELKINLSNNKYIKPNEIRSLCILFHTLK